MIIQDAPPPAKPSPDLSFTGLHCFRRQPDWKTFFLHVEQTAQKSPSKKRTITKLLTHSLIETYYECNPQFDYRRLNNPRRVLTKPSKPAHNEGYDNDDWDYILFVNDILGSQEGQQYQILDILGQGTFGQVVKCQNLKSKEIVAIKVIKNKPAYYNQSLVEVAILEMLNNKYDKDNKHHIVRMKDTFLFRNHLCIIFEMLSVNLYELIKQNQFRGLSTNLVRVFVSQILDALVVLQRCKIIHCDLKPENILLKNLESPSIKVIDFGSACHESQTIYTYIQSRFYRSPEVLLGLPYTSSIDMWSVGCIAAELFLGLPLFPGSSQYNQVKRIVDMLGVPPSYMCEKGKHSADFFNKVIGPDGKPTHELKSMEQYMKEQKTTESPPKKYFKGETLPEIVNTYPIMRKGLPSKDVEREMNNRRAFLDFVEGLLNLNPLERWSPQQAIQHPFITGEPFTIPYSVVIKQARLTLLPVSTLSPLDASANKHTAAVGHYSQFRRPRANTISSSKIQSVPPQLQRLIAMQQVQGGRFPHHEGGKPQGQQPESGDVTMEHYNAAIPQDASQHQLPPQHQQQVYHSNHQQPLAPMQQQQTTTWNNQGSQERLNHRLASESPMHRRLSKASVGSPYGSRVSLYDSATDPNSLPPLQFSQSQDATLTPPTIVENHQQGISPHSQTSAVGSPYTRSNVPYVAKRSMSQNPIQMDMAQRFPQASSWSSNQASFDQMNPYEIIPHHGDAGERMSLPSRIPSTATSAEWDMFDDLDAYGPFYSVSTPHSAASSQRSSRRSSMMDMMPDYVAQAVYQGQTGQDPNYQGGYPGPHMGYSNRSLSFSHQRLMPQGALSSSYQGTSNFGQDSQDMGQQTQLGRRYSSRNSFMNEQGSSGTHSFNQSGDIEMQVGYEEESRDQPMGMYDMAHYGQGSPYGTGTFGSPRSSTLSRGPSGNSLWRSHVAPPQQPDIFTENVPSLAPQDVGSQPPEAYQHGYLPPSGYMDGKRHSIANQPSFVSEEQQQHYNNRRRRTTQFESVRGSAQQTDPSQGTSPGYGQPVSPYSMPEIGSRQGKDRRPSDVSGTQRSPFVPRHRQGSNMKPTPEATDPNDQANHKESN